MRWSELTPVFFQRVETTNQLDIMVDHATGYPPTLDEGVFGKSLCRISRGIKKPRSVAFCCGTFFFGSFNSTNKIERSSFHQCICHPFPMGFPGSAVESTKWPENCRHHLAALWRSARSPGASADLVDFRIFAGKIGNRKACLMTLGGDNFNGISMVFGQYKIIQGQSGIG